MMLMDIEKTRKLFFISFSATRVIFIILYIYKVYRDFIDQPVLDEQQAVANRCNYVKKNNHGTFDNTGYTDFDDCYSKTLNLMTMSNIVVLTLINIVFLHFLLVVYKHYKNAGLPVV